MTTHMNLGELDGASEGIRFLLGRTTGHLVVSGGALFIAEDLEDLEEWIDTPELAPTLEIPPARAEVIEVETRQVAETVVGSETTVGLEEAHAPLEPDTEVSGEDSEAGDDDAGLHGSEGEVIGDDTPVASRSEVVSRIRSRARSLTKTQGARQTRRTHRTGRTVL